MGFLSEDFTFENTIYFRSALTPLNADLLLKKFESLMKEGKMREKAMIVGRFHHCLDPMERKKPIYLKELLGVLFALDRFKTLIEESISTLLLCDSRVAYFLLHPNVKDSGKKLSRYSIKLNSTYPTVRVLNIAGKNNFSDFLSRLDISKETFLAESLTPVKVNHELLPKKQMAFTWGEIYKLCIEHPDCITFSDKKLDINKMNEAFIDSPTFTFLSVKNHNKRMNFFDDLVSPANIIKMQEKIPFDERSLYTKKGEILTMEEKIVIPREFAPIFVLRLHFLMGHCGKTKLLDLMQLTYYVKNSAKDICTKVAQACLFCLVTDTNRNAKYPDGRFVLEEPNKTIQLDLIESLPPTHLHPSLAYLSILTITDVYSGFLNAYILKSKTTEAVIYALSNHFGIVGRPDFVITDNASIFRSKVFVRYLSLMKIALPRSAPYRSEARSLAENSNKFLQDLIKKYIFPNRDTWEVILPFVLKRLNNRRNVRHNTTPHQLLFGRDVDRVVGDEVYKHLNKCHVKEKEWVKIEEEIKAFEEKEKEIIAHMNEKKSKRQEKTNKSRKVVDFAVGDYVLVKHRVQVQGVSRKLLTAFGNIPFQIIRLKTYGAFIQSIFDDTVVLRAKNEMKLIKTIDPEELNVPKEVISLLGQVTESNLLDWFRDLNADEYVAIQTRSKTKNQAPDIDDQLKHLLGEEDESDDENEPEPTGKHVTFDI